MTENNQDKSRSEGTDSSQSSSSGSASGNSKIPDRLYFRIGDVADLLGVKPYVLRYWETEFPMVSPQKSASGQRVYKRGDVETLLMIKHLLYEERFSIEGARKRLRELRKDGGLKTYKQEKLSDRIAAIWKELPRDTAAAASLSEGGSGEAKAVSGPGVLPQTPSVPQSSAGTGASVAAAATAALARRERVVDDALNQAREIRIRCSRPITDFFRY